MPELAYPDVGAAAHWLCEAFGFEPRLRIADHRIQLTYGNGALIVVGSEATVSDPAARSTHSVLVRVDDADEHHARARAAGATVTSPPTPFGERQYSAQDPFGHRWTFSQSVADVDPRERGGALAGADGPS